MSKCEMSDQNDKTEKKKDLQCSKFRQEIAALIPTLNSELLDAIERIHLAHGGASDVEKEISDLELECKVQDKMELSAVHARKIRDEFLLFLRSKYLISIYDQNGMAVQYLKHIPTKYGLRYLDLKPETVLGSSPIKNFEDHCVVSFDDAVLPLKSFVKAIDRMAWTVKKKCEDFSIHNLSAEESASVMLFSMEVDPHYESVYTIANETLRESDETKLEPWLPYLRLLTCSLLKLPTSNKTFVYRGAPLDVSRQYPVNTTFTWQGFQFCTPSLGNIEKLLHKLETRTIFKIETQSARNIRPFSCFQAADEILLLSGKQYQVINCEKLASGSHLIHVREIAYSASPNDPDREGETLQELITPNPYRNLRLENLISEQTNASWINLGEMQLTDQDMEIAAKQAIIGKNCQEIDLGNNQITWRGVTPIGIALNINRSIKRLYLGNNHLSDEGVRRLVPYVKDSSLFVLGLSDNEITDEGTRHLRKLLSDNNRLAVLGLEKNQIGEEGICHLTLGLRANKSLQRLLLRGNKKITDTCIRHLVYLMQATQSLQKLDLRDCSFTPESEIKLRQAANAKDHFELLL